LDYIADGVIFVEELNAIVYSNEYILNSGKSFSNLLTTINDYMSYISTNEKDILYAKSLGAKIFNEGLIPLKYDLIKNISLDHEILKLIENNPEYETLIVEEFEYIKREEHNILLLKMAFILKDELDKLKTNVYMMRGSGISSFLLYVIGLNKVNPIKFDLDYKNFWK
jgi:hypothetical protein